MMGLSSVCNSLGKEIRSLLSDVAFLAVIKYDSGYDDCSKNYVSIVVYLDPLGCSVRSVIVMVTVDPMFGRLTFKDCPQV